MMDRDRRAEAAAALREFADTINGEEDSGPAADVDAAANLRDMADELEAEREGYDYEAAAAERGEALEAIISVSDDLIRVGIPTALAVAVARACEVMEGVERTTTLVERDTLRNLAAFVETVGEVLDGQRWHAGTPEPIADALCTLLGLPAAEVIAGDDDEPCGAAERFAGELFQLARVEATS